jgi:hypothetical protein
MYNSLDTLFLPGIEAGDTLYYYLFVPCGAPIESLFIFERDSIWTQDPKAWYFPKDLTFGAWNELKSGVSDTGANGTTMQFPLVQVDFEIHTDSIPS